MKSKVMIDIYRTLNRVFEVFSPKSRYKSKLEIAEIALELLQSITLPQSLNKFKVDLFV